LQETSKDFVLKELRAMIWTHRPRLLEAFQTYDRNSLRPPGNQDAAGPDWDPNILGAVTPEMWVGVMKAVLPTPSDFPWIEMRPYIAELADDGKVSYMDFLDRFRNPLSSWLTTKWCETALDRLAHIIEREPSAVFDSIDADGDGKVSYVSLRPFFRKHLYTTEPNSKKERRARDVQCFVLYRQFVSRDTTISRRKFIKILSARKPACSKQCAVGHRLASARLGVVRFFAAPRVCDDCNKAIGAFGENRFCRECDFDLCASCYQERCSRDQAHVNARKKVGESIMQNWYNLDTVHSALIAARCDVARLFAEEDAQGPAAPETMVSRERFVSIVSELVSGDTDSAGEMYNCIVRYLEEQGLDRTSRESDDLKVSELAEALRIVDARELAS